MITKAAKAGYWLAILALLLATAVAAQDKPAAQLQEMKNPVVAADFRLKNLDGKRVRLDEFRGRPVLINFWATWCPPCRKEMPSMQRLYEEYREDGLEILAVSVDTTSTAEVRAYAEELELTFSVLHDRDSLVSRLYSNPGVPASYLIDAQGSIVYRVLGEYDWFGQEAKAVVEKLLQAR